LAIDDLLLNNALELLRVLVTFTGTYLTEFTRLIGCSTGIYPVTRYLYVGSVCARLLGFFSYLFFPSFQT